MTISTCHPVNHHQDYLHRSSCPEVFCKKGALRNFTKFTGKHLCQSLFLNKVAGLQPATLSRKRVWDSGFPLNFEKYLRTHFFKEHHQWMLLSLGNCLCISFYHMNLNGNLPSSSIVFLLVICTDIKTVISKFYWKEVSSIIKDIMGHQRQFSFSTEVNELCFFTIIYDELK